MPRTCVTLAVLTALALPIVGQVAPKPVPKRISDMEDISVSQAAQPNGAAQPTSSPCQTPSDSIVRLRSAKIVGLKNVSLAAQTNIETMLTEQYYDACVMEAEITERVRDAVQQHGYYLADVQRPEVTEFDPGDGPREISVVVRVNEGDLYRLGEITFTGYSAVPVEQIRASFPMYPGEVFDVEKVRSALESLRTLYQRRGYLDFMPIPETGVDREQHAVALRIALDEGTQYRVRDVNILGLDDQTKRSLLADWTMPSGRSYNSRLLENFFLEHRYTLPPDASAEKNADVQPDSRSHVVDITLDFRDPTAVTGH